MHCISYVVALQQQRGGCPANINHIGCCTRELLHTFHNLQFCIHPVVSFVSLFFLGRILLFSFFFWLYTSFSSFLRFLWVGSHP
ncbi:unnamed protein product [Penicillium nalgiovense]|nr:unnamed protein product [Penicillium nalgiovense]